MIPVVMHQEGVDLQTAVDFVGNMCKQSIDRFNEDRANLPSWGPEIDRDVSIYVDGLANWIVGSLHWSFETERYFGKTGRQVKATRTVEILPLRAWNEVNNVNAIRFVFFPIFLTKLLKSIIRIHHSIYLFSWIHVNIFSLLRTFSHWHDHLCIFNLSIYYLASRFCLFRWSVQRIWSFVWYLLGLRRLTHFTLVPPSLIITTAAQDYLYLHSFYVVFFLDFLFAFIFLCALICQSILIVY